MPRAQKERRKQPKVATGNQNPKKKLKQPKTFHHQTGLKLLLKMSTGTNERWNLQKVAGSWDTCQKSHWIEWDFLILSKRNWHQWSQARNQQRLIRPQPPQKTKITWKGHPLFLLVLTVATICLSRAPNVAACHSFSPCNRYYCYVIFIISTTTTTTTTTTSRLTTNKPQSKQKVPLSIIMTRVFWIIL